MPDVTELVSKMPLVFRQPPKWPTPSGEWVAGHLGWEPPLGWVPIADCPQAPWRWVFWRRNEAVWPEFSRPHLVSARRSIWIGSVFIVGGVVLTAVGYAVAEAGGGSLIFWGAIIWGLIQIIRASIRIKQVNAALLNSIRHTAPQVKHNLDRMAYQEYLKSMGPGS